MAETIAAHEQDDYIPGVNQAPGSGSSGDDPLGIRYAEFGPLAFALNEGIDSITTRGADRYSLLEQIAQLAGNTDIASVEDVLDDTEHCPPMDMIMAFATTLSLDFEILLDAAQKGGCREYGPRPSVPPGY